MTKAQSDSLIRCYDACLEYTREMDPRDSWTKKMVKLVQQVRLAFGQKYPEQGI